MAEYERKYRGRELPGFVNYKTFEGMVKEQIKKLEEPAVKRLKEVSGMSSTLRQFKLLFDLVLFTLCLILFLFCFCLLEIVKDELFKLAESSFVGFPHLIRIAKVSFSLLYCCTRERNVVEHLLTCNKCCCP